MIESTRMQDDRCDYLAERYAQIAVTPPAVEGGAIFVACHDPAGGMHEHTPTGHGLVLKGEYEIQADGHMRLSGGHTPTTIRSGGR